LRGGSVADSSHSSWIAVGAASVREGEDMFTLMWPF
jgi:hypothetical protein